MYPTCCSPAHNAHSDRCESNIFPSHQLFSTWLLFFIFFYSSSSSMMPDPGSNREFCKWSSEGKSNKQWMNELIKREERTVNLQDLLNLYIYIFLFRQSVYQRWRETGRQHSWSPQNLQKHRHRNVSLCWITANMCVSAAELCSLLRLTPFKTACCISLGYCHVRFHWKEFGSASKAQVFYIISWLAIEFQYVHNSCASRCLRSQ